MNIAEILKKCPKGTKLYSPIGGECILNSVMDNSVGEYPIVVKWAVNSSSFISFFDGEGRYLSSGEVLLFPSKDQRDWSKFKVPREDLAEGTPCVCFENKLPNLTEIALRYYFKDSKCKVYEEKTFTWDYIIPVDKFNFKDLTFNEEDNYGKAYNGK